MKRTFSRQEKEIVFDLWKRDPIYNDVTRVLDAQPGSILTVLRNVIPSVKTRVFLGYSSCRGGTPPIAECGRILL